MRDAALDRDREELLHDFGRRTPATQSLLLGSVAYKVVHLGKVPVLIAR